MICDSEKKWISKLHGYVWQGLARQDVPFGKIYFEIKYGVLVNSNDIGPCFIQLECVAMETVGTVPHEISHLTTAWRSRDICMAGNLSDIVFFSLKDLKPRCSFANQGFANLWETLKFPRNSLFTTTEGTVYSKEEGEVES